MNQERPTTSVRIINDEKSKQTLFSTKTARTDAQISQRLTNTRIIQNFHVVWLDTDADKMDKESCHNKILKLRQVVNTVNTFTDVDECTNFINDVKDEKVFMIVSDKLGQTVIPIVHDLPQMSSIYIFCENMAQHEEWTKRWRKVKGVLTDTTSIYELLKQVAVSCDQNYASISFIPKNTGVVNPNFDQLDQSFMYSYILKEIILTINFDQTHIDQFLAYSREQLAGNTLGLQNIDRLEKEYYSHCPIWWYTYEYLLYSMINRALRTMEVDTIIKMGFFLRDLHQQIIELHSEQFASNNHSNSFKVFRGQGLSQTDFNKLMKTEGGLLSFNCFLSTSFDREVAFAFADSIQSGSDMIGVLFQITIDPSIDLTPFAKIHNFSHYQIENEILFSMHSVFRIEQIKQIEGNNRFWEVNLTLTSDSDLELRTLTEHIREETYPTEKGWHRLGTLLLKLGQYDKAKKVCELLLNQEFNAHDEEFIYHMLGWANNSQGHYLQALTFYEKALVIREKALSPNFTDLGNSYNDIGTVYFHMGDYSKALPYYEKGLEIRQKYLHQNHPHLAHSFNNMAVLYKIKAEYSKAFAFHEKSLEVHLKSRSPNHPMLVVLYNNMGSVLKTMGEYTKALLLHERALQICEKYLPSNHPDLIICHASFGCVYSKLGDYSKALSSHEKSLEIGEEILPPNHPTLALSYSNIGLVYYQMLNYSRALSYMEKACEIYRDAMLSNHYILATVFNNIGLVHFKMNDYSNAILYYEKAFEIYQESLPSNHLDFGIYFNNTGKVYFSMSDYSKAILNYEKALEIFEKCLPSNHETLTICLINTGSAYVKIGDHLKAREIINKIVLPAEGKGNLNKP